MKNLSLVLFILIFSLDLKAQLFEVDGGMKVMTMNVDNACDSLVVRQTDGTLALRELSSIGGVGVDQVLSISNDTVFLSNGGFVKLPTGGGGGGSQTLSITNDMISITGGNTITLPSDEVNDADADASNELQTLTIVEDTLYLTDGGQVTLPSGGGSGSQTLTISNNMVSITGGNTITLPSDNIEDADADPLNEIQDLSFSGDTIFLEHSSNEYIVIPGLKNLPYLNITIQERLNRGATPLQIYQMGFPLDSIYGRNYKGGFIFYIDTQDDYPGMDGLVAAPADIEAGEADFIHPWGCNVVDPIPNASPPAQYTRIGDGVTNTSTIIADACSVSGDAAYLADGYVYEEYSDWFLPSITELTEMYAKIGYGASGVNNNAGGFTTDSYWSSSVGSDNASWRVDFNTGTASGGIRSTQRRIRAVRSF